MNRLKVLALALATTLLVPAAARTATLPVIFWGDFPRDRAQGFITALNDIYGSNGVNALFTLGGVGGSGKTCDDLRQLNGVHFAFVPYSPGGGLGQAPVNGLPIGANSRFCAEIASALLGGTPPPYPSNGLELLLAHEMGHMLGLIDHHDNTLMNWALQGMVARLEPWQMEILNEGSAQAATAPAKAAGGGLLLGRRFTVEATWQTAEGSGTGKPVALTSDSGYLWFFDAANIEVTVKVLDGCGVNGRYWVFMAGMTNVEVTLTVTDTETGASKTYVNSQGRAFAPIQDTNAFATCE